MIKILLIYLGFAISLQAQTNFIPSGPPITNTPVPMPPFHKAPVREIVPVKKMVAKPFKPQFFVICPKCFEGQSLEPRKMKIVSTKRGLGGNAVERKLDFVCAKCSAAFTSRDSKWIPDAQEVPSQLETRKSIQQ